MKQLIVPVAIIIALIAFFVIIDRKEFSRHDDVQTVQNGNSTIKPTVSVPETKPVTDVKPAVEAKPVDETRPVTNPKHVTEAKPVTETEPKTDTKSTEAKPGAETKPVDETKPGAKTNPEEKAPAAVPVVTAEEAEKLNELAIVLSNENMTLVEGEITARSKLPDPENSDYPNCRFTVHFIGNTIQSGNPCPKELSLVVEGFENYRVLPNNDIKKGDKVLCSIIPFEKLPEDYQSTQQADDLDLFLLDSYYVLDIQVIKEYTDSEPRSPISGIDFIRRNDNYVSIYERQLNPPISEEIEQAQNFAIQTDLDRITKELRDYDDAKKQDVNARFKEAWIKEKEKDPPNFNRVTTSRGTYVWRNINGSFWTLPVDYNLIGGYGTIQDYNLQALVAFRDYLHLQGIQLVISIVPDEYDISARVINRAFKDVPDFRTAIIVKQLLENGIEAVYPSKDIIDNYNRYPWAFFFPDNVHAADTTQDILAEILAERIKRFHLESNIDRNKVSFVQKPHSYSSNPALVWPSNCDIGTNVSGENYMMNAALYDNHPIPKDNSSPILVIGNSQMQTPMYPESLPTILATKTLHSVDWYRVNTIGLFTTAIDQIAKFPEDFLSNKVVVILQSGISFFSTSSRFSNIKLIDKNAIILNNKNLICDIPPELMLKVKNKSFILTDDSLLTVELNGADSFIPFCNIKASESALNHSKDIILRIPAVSIFGTHCKIKANDSVYEVQECHEERPTASYLFVSVPAGTKDITISVSGAKSKSVKIGKIGIFQ